MPLTAGSRLGPYEILSALGAGGMGEVYRARDTKLNRDVAIKVLPDVVATDPERLARFHREAQVLAALNHPNIAHIHGYEESNGVHALVMELVEGPTLTDRIANGPIPISEALLIAKQIAEGLEAAHDQGIIHRDLKPANIKVREDGTVKVLDFGLAKMLHTSSEHASASLTASPTLTSPAMMTGIGVILGTAAYMSPEQAKGRPVDKRTDVWAFGCVLYEMLTRRRAFDSDSVTGTLAAILERDVDWTRLPPTVPARVRTVLMRALVKDSKHRLHDIADARIELEDDKSPATLASSTRRGNVMSQLVVLAATAAAAGLSAWYLKPAPAPRAETAGVTRLAVTPDAPLAAESQGIVALSPDGRLLAYVGTTEGHTQLFLRRLDQFDGKPIAGTEGAESPAFSPDGRWIAFEADRKIKKTAVTGGQPVTVCEFAEGIGLSWESNETILFHPGRASGIFRVAAAGGAPSPVTTLGPGETEHHSPEILPGGKALLYTAVSGTGSSQIFAQSLSDGRRRLLASGAAGHYLATGHLAYIQGTTMFVLPFDAARLEIKGSPVPIIQGVHQTRAGTAQVAYSATGSIAYLQAVANEGRDTVVWVHRDGVERPTSVSGAAFSMPRLSPDLTRVAMLLGGGNGPQGAAGDLWAYDLDRGTRSRLTFDGASTFPLWSPDGARLAYSSGKSGRFQITVKTIDGTAADEVLSSNEGTNYPLSWSPDGKSLAAVSVNPTTANDIWLYSLSKPPAARPFLRTQFREGAPTFSPDGRWIAYASDQSGRSEIYMRPLEGAGEELTISTDGGTEPLWAQQAGQLFYRQGNAMMVVDIATTPRVSVGRPRRLFEGRYNFSFGFWPNYAVTRDGQRFLMIKGAPFETPTRLNVVLNWFDELKGRVPTK